MSSNVALGRLRWLPSVEFGMGYGRPKQNGWRRGLGLLGALGMPQKCTLKIAAGTHDAHRNGDRPDVAMCEPCVAANDFLRRRERPTPSRGTISGGWQRPNLGRPIVCVFVLVNGGSLRFRLSRRYWQVPHTSALRGELLTFPQP
jgi:hypothetical protein